MKTLLLLLACLLAASCQTTEEPGSFDFRGRKIIGYWHSWDSRETDYLPLREVPPYVNQVNLAFATPDDARPGHLIFPHEGESDQELVADIRSLKDRGMDVLLSVGGGNHPIELTSEEERDAFVLSLIDLVTTLGVTGVDLNLEGPSVILDEGDVDFRNPTTPKIRYLIEAVRAVDAHFQGRLVLSVAPETQYVVGGYARYGGAYGGYLPILHALREELDLVHVQLYNSGSQYAYLGDPTAPPSLIVEPATPDFVVALTEMMIQGFPVGQDPEALFPGFPQDKVVVGLPSSPDSGGNGALTSAEYRKAMNRLLTGEAGEGLAYPLRTASGYPELKGVMTWSLNWDASSRGGRRSYDFVRTAGEVLREVLEQPRETGGD